MKKNLLTLLLISLMMILPGCNMPSPQQFPGEPTPDLNLILTQIAENVTEVPADTAEPAAAETEDQPVIEETAEIEESPEPTAEPKKTETLTICLGKEPKTLFFYAESSQAMWSVLESIYNGPFDVGDGKADPVIFEDITVTTEPVTVVRGDVIVDHRGNAVELKPGTVFLPSEPAEDCSGKGCLVTWTSLSEEAEIDRMVITYHLKEGLRWNDGTPLTAEDSVYSMTVNGMKGINASKQLYNLTESYTAPDEYTVVWRGLPGYKPQDPAEVFWTPLPSHTMKGMSAEDLLTADSVNQMPLGWGAWQIVSWVKGEEITAERNPYYTDMSGSEPFFDRIVYKFYGRSGDNSLEALRSGTCDIIDTSVDLGADLEPILEDVRDGKTSIYIRPELSRQEVVFNLTPPVNTWSKASIVPPDLRKALIQGIDRQAVIRQVLYGQSEIPVDFYPSDHIAHNDKLTGIAYDPEAAKAALDSMGWTVPEDSTDGVRIATQVSGVMYGLPLSFTLTAADTVFSRKAAEMIRDDLAELGVELTVNELPLSELFAQGPEGAIFGGKFDTVLFAWAAGNKPCAIYLSDEVPSAENHWVGTNVGNYQNEIFDEACLLPELTEADAGQIFAEELPAVPLYFNISIAASANTICGISDRIGSRSVLWNMESFSRSDGNCSVSQWNDIYR